MLRSPLGKQQVQGNCSSVNDSSEEKLITSGYNLLHTKTPKTGKLDGTANVRIEPVLLVVAAILLQ